MPFPGLILIAQEMNPVEKSDNPDIEDETHDLPVGVGIKDLRKVFKVNWTPVVNQMIINVYTTMWYTWTAGKRRNHHVTSVHGQRKNLSPWQELHIAHLLHTSQML